MSKTVEDLTYDDVALIAALKAERVRLQQQQQVIRNQLKELTDESIAKKFQTRIWRVQEIEY